MPENPVIDQPAPVRAGEMLPTAVLEAHLLTHLPGSRGPLVVEQFPRGYSNLTYLLRLGEQELVLRRPPFGANIKTAHDMAREVRILRALVDDYPKVPRPLLYCDDPAVLDVPFYVMQRVPGVILRNRPPQGVVLSTSLMRALSEALVDTLVELHAVDYVAAGLGDLGRPEGYVARQVSGWIERYRRARTDDLPDMEAAAAWMVSHQPPSQGAALIHNDFKYDNLVLDPNDLTRVLAVLDWEMATIGDPLMDLGTTLAYWIEANDAPELQTLGLTSHPGNLTRREVVARYAVRSGRDVGDILFYYVFGLFKVGVIGQQIYYRYRQGFTQDPRFASLIHLIAACGRQAVQAIQRGEIA